MINYVFFFFFCRDVGGNSFSGELPDLSALGQLAVLFIFFFFFFFFFFLLLSLLPLPFPIVTRTEILFLVCFQIGFATVIIF